MVAARANQKLSQSEQIKKYHLLADKCVADEDELTSPLKLKRRAIDHKYNSAIEPIYFAAPEPVQPG